MTADTLGDRMKDYEAVQRATLPRRAYTILRVDGRAFHTWTRGLDRPYDDRLAKAMDDTAAALCTEVQGACLAFVESDEISVLYTDFGAAGTQPWFGGIVQKQVSIGASVATAAFNQHVSQWARGLATFDARVFTVPDATEAANYLIWRQRDAVRNSISMAAQAVFSQRELHRVTTGQMQEMLWQRGINWNDYPVRSKRGGLIVKQTGERDVTYVDRRDGLERTITAVRSWWEAVECPHFTVDSLAPHIPVRKTARALTEEDQP